MRIILRRERRRRNVMALQGRSLPLPHNTLVEHGALRHHTARYSDRRILVTRDRYLASGIRHSPIPLCLCRIYEDINEALATVNQTQPLCLIVDLEDCQQPVMSLLDQLRDVQHRNPELDIVLMASETDPVSYSFLQRVCRCRIVDKQIALPGTRDVLLAPSLTPLLPQRLFKAKEWSVLLLMAKGHSLSHVARLQIRPYHRIIYRVGCIMTLLGLGHRQQLLRVLQRVSALRDRYHSG
ncbi:hypothetical protein [Enterobacter sp. CC120223-11]|uniref:hypothetical protein n=1 Tax=Enterobacter sp. CC120223-11 TaxID=1378073 RepID=UPI000BD50CB1|nr:hypothetical protein [Enterobacter sp. CC120223-11]SNY62325.1 fimbrial protein FimY [Enterobacter sp. CC120223-11]